MEHILDYFTRINVDSARIVGVTSPGSLTKYAYAKISGEAIPVPYTHGMYGPDQHT